MTSEQRQIKKLYHSYRHTTDIDRKGLFFSPTCMQICRPVPAYAATSRSGIVRYLKDAQTGNVPVKNTSPERRKSETEPEEHGEIEKRRVSEAGTPSKPVVEKNVKAPESTTKIGGAKSRGVYTIRPLHQSEYEFSTNTVTASVGYKAAALQQKAKSEGWVGMRVDLWDEGSPSAGLLVKVQYWWRWEAVNKGDELEGDRNGFGWRQCLHDIMYLGKTDGSQGEEGLEVLE